IRRPLLRRRPAPGVVLRPRHELAARRGADDRECADRRGVARGVHEAEEAAPADPEDVDGAEAEGLPHALDVVDELVLGAPLDGIPARAAVAAMIVEHEAEAERARQRGRRPREPGRVGARSAVEAETRRAVADDLGVKPRPVDGEIHDRRPAAIYGAVARLTSPRAPAQHGAPWTRSGSPSSA